MCKNEVSNKGWYSAGRGKRARSASGAGGAGVWKLCRTSDAVSARAGGEAAAGGPWEVPLMTSPLWRRTRDVIRRDIATSLGGGGLSNAPTVRKRVPPRTFSRSATTYRLTEWVSARAVSGMCSAAWGSCWASWDCRARASVWTWSLSTPRWTPTSLRQVSARTTIRAPPLLCLFSLSLCRTSGCCRLCVELSWRWPSARMRGALLTPSSQHCGLRHFQNIRTYLPFYFIILFKFTFDFNTFSFTVNPVSLLWVVKFFLVIYTPKYRQI